MSIMELEVPPAVAQEDVRFCRPADIPSGWANAWDALAHDASEPNVFLERWFMEPSLAHLPHPDGLRLAFVWDGIELIGISAFFIARRYGRMVLPHVQTWSHYHSFLGTPLVRKGKEHQFWSQLLRALDATDWADGLLHLTGLVDGDRLHESLLTTCKKMGRACDTVHVSERALLQSDLSAAAYYETNVRKKKRKEIGRLKSRLAELGAVEFETAETEAQALSFADQFLYLELRGWKGKAGSALLCLPETDAFFRSVIDGAWSAGKLEIQRLSVGGNPIAILVNFIALPGSFSYKIAFDETYARFSPGVLIQLENLRCLERKGFGWMDSCAVENHPMINSLWAERRKVIRVSIPLGGLKRGMVFRLCRTAEESWAQLKRLKGTSKPLTRPNGQTDD